VSEQFYVRIRGRVQGPYDTSKLQSLVRRGQLSRMHEVSNDGSLWRPAAEFPELFTTPVAAQAVATATKDHSHQASEIELESPAIGASEWYYAVNQEQKGPISFDQLKALAQAGVVTASSLVWQEGMAEWTPAQSVPGIRGAVGHSSTSTGLSSDGSNLDADSLRTLKETIPWVSFLIVCVITTSCLMLLLGVAGILLGVREHQMPMVAGGCFFLLYSCVGIWGGMLLNGYNSNIKKFVNSRSPQSLELAFKNLKTFWTFISIIVIFVIVNLIVGVIWVFSFVVSVPQLKP
jgi:hypothetical protein